VSAREWRAVREGETHAATKTSTNNTPESFIVGVGASGALLAGAAILFVTLVGLVSFNVWPTGHEVSADGNVELSAATPGGSAASSPVGAAAGQVASTSVSGPSGGGAATTNTGGSGNQGAGNGNGGKPGGGLQHPPAATTPPSTTDNSGTSFGGDTRAPGTATKDPTGPVHPTHPDTPHRNVPDGTHGKDEPGENGGDSGVVDGKGPFGRPSGSDSSDSSGTGSFPRDGRGHESPHFKH
jgi:hypothetical protein